MVADGEQFVDLVSRVLACHAVVTKAFGEALGIPLNVITDS
jgi:hypothetical protein